MRDRFLAAWRTAAQAGFALLLAWAANHGLHIDPHWSGIVEVAVIGAGAGVWAFGVHWLQTRSDRTPEGRLARLVGRILVAGAGTAPAYPAQPASSAEVPPAGP